MGARRINLRLALALTLSVPGLGWTGESMPKDVQRFVQQRDLCDHLRGEAEAADAIARANRACRGTDKQLQRLKARHRNLPQVTHLLDAYEPQIEARRQAVPTPKR